VGVITNIGSAHAGLLGGTEGIARAKGELIEALPDDGLAVLDADDAFTERIAARAPAGTRILRVSARGTHGADVVASGIKLDHEVRPSFTLETPWGRAPVRLGVHGDHQVVNALLAAAVALDRGVALAAAVAGLERVRPAPWRMEVLRTPAGAIVLNDAYNANPASTEAALRAFVEIDTAGRRVAVLGEMRELGTHSADEHARIGHLVGELGIDVVVVVGPEAEPLAAAAKAHPDVEVRVATDAEHALDEVRAALRADDDAVLVKASRAVGLERVAHALTEPVGRSGTEPVGRSGTEPA
jgi:UDP-N-acetylmuramoyl-tripeptide--D-alanyl-D-alanine ligase